MKTLTSTLAIFALLFSVTTFGTNLNEEKTQNLNIQENASLNSDINPPLVAKKPDPIPYAF